MITEYHRPTTISEAVALLNRKSPPTVPLGGGTVLNAGGYVDATAVVDLQALALDQITLDGSSIELGAVVRLSEVASSEVLHAVLRDLARREAPNTLRNAATVGGTVAEGDWESELLAGFLAFGAVVGVTTADGEEEIQLADLLEAGGPAPGSLITRITITGTGSAAADRVARTPADRPIVAAVAFTDGAVTRVAYTGVATTPVVLSNVELSAIEPPGDFRGTSEYRHTLATVIGDRVSKALESAS